MNESPRLNGALGNLKDEALEFPARGHLKYNQKGHLNFQLHKSPSSQACAFSARLDCMREGVGRRRSSSSSFFIVMEIWETRKGSGTAQKGRRVKEKRRER